MECKKNNRIRVTAMTWNELKLNSPMWYEAATMFNKWLRRHGVNIDDFSRKFNGQPYMKGYDMMMRRTGGVFSCREWYNMIVA